jgi:hypothetical protein
MPKIPLERQNDYQNDNDNDHPQFAPENSKQFNVAVFVQKIQGRWHN